MSFDSYNKSDEVSDQIKKNETGVEYGTYGRQKRCIQGFGGET
jgi:hypothetical protein